MRVSFEFNARTVLRWTLGVIFIWAALSKIANPQQFFADLVAYRLPLGWPFLRSVAVVLPWLELLCGLLLLSNVKTGGALVWVVVLSATFALATGQAWARGLHISCGCIDLTLLGLADDSAVKRLLEAPAAAFTRALLLMTAAGSLLVRDAREAGASSSSAIDDELEMSAT